MMNMIQTFVATPFYNKGAGAYQNIEFGMGGFASRLSFYSMWVNSYFSLKKRFPKTSLYCDVLGGELLIEKIGLDYDDVIIIDTPYFAKNPSGLWAYNKLYTYSVQMQPFLHFDGDFILNTRLSEDVQNVDVMFEYPHIQIHPDFIKMIKSLLWIIKGDSYFYSKFNFLFDVFNSQQSKRPIMYNFGVFGGNAISNISRFSTISMELAEYIVKKDVIKDYLQVNIFLEQFLLTQMAYADNLSISSLQSKQLEREKLLEFFEKGYAISHIHTMSYYKVLFKPYIDAHLFNENPELFQKIVHLIRNCEI